MILALYRLSRSRGLASRGLRCCALLAVAVLVCLPSAAGKSEPRPYTVALDVVWGQNIGPESWREELEGTLAKELRHRNCFPEVRRFDPENSDATPLVLRVGIDHFLERSTYGVGIAALQNPDATPDTRQSQTAEIEAKFRVDLATGAEGVTFKAKNFADHAEYRPVMNEDPRFKARTRLLESARRAIANLVCKGSLAKFEKEWKRALDEASGVRKSR